MWIICSCGSSVAGAFEVVVGLQVWSDVVYINRAGSTLHKNTTITALSIGSQAVNQTTCLGCAPHLNEQRCWHREEVSAGTPLRLVI